MLNYHRLLSRPLQVEWAGWRTDTYRLQACGWQLSADQDVFQNAMRLSMQHEGQQIRAISERISFDYHMAISDTPEYLSRIVIPMHMVGREVTVHFSGSIDWHFKPIDATPSFSTHTISKIEDLCHFAAPLVKTREIIIPQDSVPELLERILKLQQPARTDRVREEYRRHPEAFTATPQQRMEAQIISLAA